MRIVATTTQPGFLSQITSKYEKIQAGIRNMWLPAKIMNQVRVNKKELAIDLIELITGNKPKLIDTNNKKSSDTQIKDTTNTMRKL